MAPWLRRWAGPGSRVARDTTPNIYPIVNEAHLVNLSRVPSGYSLILGGFVTVNNTISNNKVPVLGSIPVLGQAFRFKSVTRSRTNLAFIITPIAFQAENPERSVEVSDYDRRTIIGPERDLAEPDLIGRVNENATDFHNALSNGESRNRTRTRSPGIKSRKPKKRHPSAGPRPRSAIREAGRPVRAEVSYQDQRDDFEQRAIG